jgi:hypothetical protein
MEDMQTQIFEKDMELQIVNQTFSEMKRAQDDELKKLKRPKKVNNKDSTFDELSNQINLRSGESIDMNMPSGRGPD